MKKPTHPESYMMSHGYNTQLSEGSIKTPLFQTSTFVFNSAEEGKEYFSLAYGLKEAEEGKKSGLIYSRVNNPNLEILEDRLTLWDDADDAAVFSSGMAAITTTFLTFLSPGDLVLYSSPTYGGTDHFINDFLLKIGVEVIYFSAENSKEEIQEIISRSSRRKKLKMIYVETPANPTNAMIDLQMCRAICDTLETDTEKPILCVDNTYMGPVWSSPLRIGADLVVYSATKYIGGHSDLIAGAVMGNLTCMTSIKVMRTFLGNMASPFTSWLMLRSLETMKIRMEQQALNATHIASYLSRHKKIKKVYYLGLIEKSSPEYKIYSEQYDSPGAMISFEVEGGEREAFNFLNHLKLIQLAVSLGSTESLIQHPKSMTHCAVDPKKLAQMHITDSLIRLSVGVENRDDLISDLEQALEKI